VAIFVAGLVAHVNFYSFSPQVVLLFLGSGLALALLFRVSQIWEAVVIFGTVVCLGGYIYLRPDSRIFLTTAIVGLLVAPALQIAYQWERGVVLRFGKFQALRTPGPVRGHPGGRQGSAIR